MRKVQQDSPVKTPPRGAKQSYATNKATFVLDGIGKVILKVTTNRRSIVIQKGHASSPGIPITSIRNSDNNILRACLNADPDKFEEFVSGLEKL